MSNNAAQSQEYRMRHYAERVVVDDHLEHPNPPTGHGTLTAYNSYGCRCQACRDKQNAYYREVKSPEVKRKRGRKLQPVERDLTVDPTTVFQW